MLDFQGLRGGGSGRRKTIRGRAITGQLEGLEGRQLLSAFQATYEVSQDWGTGFQAEIQVKNTGTEPIQNWSLAFDYPARTWLPAL
jgi:hypothetical protein